MRVFTYRIAELVLQTETDVYISYLESEPFKLFQIDDCVKPDVSQRIKLLDFGSFTLPPLDDMERDLVLRTEGFQTRWLDSPVFRFPELRAAVRGCLGHLDLASIELAWNRVTVYNFAHNEFSVFYPPEKGHDFVSPAFHAGYRNWLARFLPNFKAIMVHGAGVVSDGFAAVFLASDGGGKSAAARKSGRRPILNDDHLILRRDAEGFVVYATPFGCLTSGPRHARLGGLFLLEKASRFELTPVQPADALKFLWNEHKLTWAVLPKSLRISVFRILSDVCHQVPVCRLRLPKDHLDWDAIDAAMGR